MSSCFCQLTLKTSCQNLHFKNCCTNRKKTAINPLISQVNEQITSKFKDKTEKMEFKSEKFEINLVFGETYVDWF